MYISQEIEQVPIVVVDNFLPTNYLNSLTKDIFKLKPHFRTSKWYNDDDSHDKHNCNGDDVWIPFHSSEGEKNSDIGASIADLQNFLFQEGIIDFLKNCKSPYLNNYSRFDYNYAYHVINYANGGYYNWHLDHKVINPMFLTGQFSDIPESLIQKSVTYTFALTLIKDESKLQGGKQLFMKDGKIFELPSKNNQLVIIPSNVYHSLTEIISDEDLPWENRRFNLQAWLCHI